DREESNSATPTAQFIMLPLTAHSVLENPASIKLTTTYTRRGTEIAPILAVLYLRYQT
ncbi:hypothetical protein E2320_015369, partial [Naja naja]